MARLWTIFKTSILSFIAHGALSRGAAISFYTVTSMSPILLIVVGFALAFVTAMLVVRALIGFVSRYGFGVFAWYRIALGSVALVLLAAVRYL